MNETLQRYIFYISCVLLLKNCFSSKLLMALREKINIRWWSQKEYVIKNQLNKTASSDRHFFRPFVASLACFSFLHLPLFSAAQILQHTPMLVPSALLRSSANWEIQHLRCKQKIHGVSSCDYYSGPHLASNQRTRFYLYPKVAALWPCGLLVNVHKRVGASCGGLTLSVSVIFLLSCTPIQVAGELTSVFSLSLFPLSQTPITPSFDSDTHTKKIGTYFNCIMFMVASSVVTTIMILNYHHRLADTHEMPPWVSTSTKEASGSWLSESLRSWKWNVVSMVRLGWS